MTINIGINGFGRIGRNVFRLLLQEENVNVVAINDLTDTKTLAYLLKYDSIHGPINKEIDAQHDYMTIEQKNIYVAKEADPAKINWAQWDVDIVIEATGKFNDADEAKKHLESGAQKVIISAPAKNSHLTIVFGVNESDYSHEEHHIISNASCTTNCIAPLAKILHEYFGIEKGLMTTVHAYTGDQRLLDMPHRDLRRTRAAAENIVPTTTGAAKAVGKVLPDLDGKLDGMAFRVPVANGSVVDLVANLKKQVTKEQIKEAFIHEANNSLKGIIKYVEEPIVSKDIIGSTYSTIIDGLSTLVLQDQLIKIVAWYDNEIGYSARCVDLIRFIKQSFARN